MRFREPVTSAGGGRYAAEGAKQSGRVQSVQSGNRLSVTASGGGSARLALSQL